MTATQPSQIDLPDAMFQLTVAETVVDAIKGRADTLRGELTHAIAEEYAATAQKCSLDVRIPGTTDKVGSVSTTISQDKAIVGDEDAFIAWAMETMPQELEVKYVLRDSTKKALLNPKNLTFIDMPADPEKPEGETVKVAHRLNKETGELEAIPGVKFVKGGTVGSFAVNGRKTDEAKALILRYLDEVGLPAVLAGADNAIESAAKTVSGEVLAGEVVAKDEEAAA